MQVRALKCFTLQQPEDKNCTKYLCQIINNESSEICGKKLDGKKKSNLTSHIQAVHPAYFKKHINLDYCHEEMSLLRLKYIQNRSEIIAVNLRPYELLNDSGFRKASENELNKLAEHKFAVGLADNTHGIYKRYIAFVASKIRERIALEVKNKFVSAMADITQKHNRSFLGIQIQFNNKNETIKRSLGVVELNEKHTAANLKRIMFETLGIFGIEENQLATVTVDNGSNFIAMIKSMNDTYGTNDNNAATSQTEHLSVDSIHLNREELNSVSSSQLFSDDEIQLMIMEAEAEMENEEESTSIEIGDEVYLDDETEYDNLLADLNNEFVLRTKYISGIRCGEHTLQLGITDMLKSQGVAVLIRLAKATVIKLRRSSYRNKLIELKIEFKIPHMYCTTRWGSEFVMVR